MAKKSIQAILEEKGPMLSGELAAIYELENGTNNTNARQAISRARSPIQKNKLIPFQNNQVFVYLEKQFNSGPYWYRLNSAISSHSKIVATYIRAMISQAGIMSKHIMPAYTPSPINNLKGHRKFDSLLGNLIKSEIIKDYGDNKIYLSHTLFSAKSSNSLARSKAIELSKWMVLNDFCDLMKNINASSYNKGKIWSEFAHFQWGYTAPSYVKGIATWDNKNNKLKPGFILADVILEYYASEDDISFFIEKLKIIQSFRNISNYVPSLIVFGVEPKALERLKQNNVIIIFIDKVFGTDYANLLKELIHILANATTLIINNSEEIDRIFATLAKMGGRYNNIVGAMFELMVAELFWSVGVNYLELNREVPAHETRSGKPKEIDVFVDKDGTIFIIECKATISAIDEEFVQKWLSIKIPDIYKYLRLQYPNKKYEFQIWSIGGFTETAESLLKKRKLQTKKTKYSIEYLTKAKMLEFARERRAKVFISHIKKHFPDLL